MSVAALILLCCLSIVASSPTENDQEINTPVPGPASELNTHPQSSPGNLRIKRKAVKDLKRRWLNNEVPYRFGPNFYTDQEAYLVRRAMTDWERYTCLKFRPATDNDRNSIRFQNDPGCNSQLGMVGGVQEINLEAPGCRFKGLYLHEIGHAIGLIHEHQRPVRDEYIIIDYENVTEDMRIWFDKYPVDKVNNYSVPYDLSSIMHYETNAFSFDGESQTIHAIDKSKEDTIGKVYAKELAYSDVWVVNLMYNCASHCPNKNKCGTDGHLDQNCNCICKDGSSDCDTTKKTPKDPNCRNTYSNSFLCYIWANEGECEANPGFMRTSCAKACGVCGNDATSGTCKDVYETKCPVWKARGDCVTNKRWMKINCGATCNLCVNNPPQSNCRNTNQDSQCDQWAQEGECAANPIWMGQNCKKSCMACTEDIATIDDVGDINTDAYSCDDYHSQCKAWAAAGDCETNGRWMLANCRKSCDRCDDGTCKNLNGNPECKEWALDGECTSNPTWMTRYCAKACGSGVCDGIAPTPVTRPKTTTVPTPAPCIDRKKDCQAWAASGECAANPLWMIPNCRKSCNKCEDGTCKNMYDDSQCQGWASSGECESNPVWMGENCAKACRVCHGDSSEENTTPKPTSSTPCRNIHNSDMECDVWAQGGHCEINPGFMKVNCAKSCRVCDADEDNTNNDSECRNIYGSDADCDSWAKNDQCRINPSFMLNNCAKSCKVCHA